MELTLKDLKNLLSEDSSPVDLHSGFIGRYCVIRSYGAGVFVGKLAKKDGQTVLSNDAIRIHYWSGAASLSQLAMEGVKNPSECRFATPVPEILIEQVIEIIPCSQSAIENIKGVESWIK